MGKEFSAHIVSTKVDTYQSRSRDPIPCRPTVGTHQQQQEPVSGGVGWICRTVGAMDGAIEPPWTGLRRVLHI
ncbi:hypothetical protein O0J71_21280, partial [Stenotrophomonas sp. Sm3119]|uniref:hypothetical protein n=1 Tax=Stenotrophomonas sp. Sm3119 TaxID=3002744 RepID=UPI0027E4EA07